MSYHMARLLTWLSVAALVATLSGCGKPVKELPVPPVSTVTVHVATPVPCPALAKLGAEPLYPDTDEAIAASRNIGELAALYAKGRAMRVQRLFDYAVAKSACIF